MAIASTRAVPGVFGATLRSSLMAAASGALLLAQAPVAKALPDCTGDGSANTCVIGLDPLNLDPAVADIATESVDGAAGTDKLQFTGGGFLSLDSKTIGSALSTTVRFANFEEGQVTGATALTLTGAATDTIQSVFNWTIDAGSSLFAQGGNAIGDGSSVTVNGSFAMGTDNKDETIGSLLGTGTVNLFNARTLTVGGNATSTTFSGLIVSTGNLVKTGAGMLTLSGANSYTGTTTAAGGILEVGHANAIATSSLVTVNSGAILQGTVAYNVGGNVVNNGSWKGNANVVGNVTNNGVMQPGQSPGTMTIGGNYSAGATSFFDMEIDLDAAIAAPVNGTTHDFISIGGNVTPVAAGNKTYVFFTALNTPDAGLPTTLNGIEIIRIGGTTTAGDFVQGNALNAGAYQYLLRYLPNYSGATDGYFLQSAARDELVAHPALLTAGQNLIRNCFRDDQRVPDSPKGASYGRAWFGYHQGNSSFGADTGVEMDQDFSCTSGGMDWRMGHGWFGGVSGGFGSTQADIAAPAGIGSLDGDARVIEVYASFTSSSLFVNLSAGYNDMDWIYDGALLSGATASTSGLIASAQAGVALDAEMIAVKLIGAINYDDTNCGDACFGFAATEDTGTLEAKGTVRFDGVSWGGSVRPWAAVSYSDVLSDGINTVSSGAITVSSQSLNQLLSLDAGLQTYLDENLSLYLDGGYHESLGKDVSGYKAGLGMKLYW